MLGEKIGTAVGHVTGQRVLPNPSGPPKLETSFQTTGKLLGVDCQETGTYWSLPRPDGTLYGEGQGLLTGKRGETASWVGAGVGTRKRDGSVSYRGAVFYQSSSAKWRRLNAVVAVFEYSVDPAGTSTTVLWEWK